VPGVGWLAYVKDPDGNILGLLQADPAASFLFTYPANQQTQDWTVLPENWESQRRHWE